VGQIVAFCGRASLGQEPDACAALMEMGVGVPEGELATPVLDLSRLRELLLTERAGGAPGIPPSPTTLSRLTPSPVAGPSPFERQVPIYLLPEQAGAQMGFLVAQQREPILAMYTRRLFQFAPEEGG